MSEPRDPSSLEPLLLPAPFEITLLGGRVPRRDPRLSFAPGHGREGYRLSITDEGSLLEASEPTGSTRGLATIEQLVRQYGAELPRLEIVDRPAFEHRGWMLDVSRDRVPTQQHLAALVAGVARLKLDEFELYTEHSFAYPGHEQVWREASPITADELRALDAEALRQGVRLVANQNCFGHFERWLRHPPYAPLAETHGRFRFEGIELEGPFSLCPVDPGSLELVRELLDQLLPCVSSGAVNVGGDETQDVGQGRSSAAVAARGAFAVQAEFLGAVAEHAVGQGFEPRFWADLAVRHPEQAAQLHPALVPIAWGYEPDHPFEAQGRILAAGGRPFHLACGSSSWRSFTGRTSERRANLERCLAAARTHSARGVLLTEWGDLGHRQVPALGQLALAEFAGRAWNPTATVDPRAVSLQVFGDRSLRIAHWIAALGDLDRDLRAVSGIPAADGSSRPLTNASALFEALHQSGFPFRLPAEPAPWAATLERLANLRAERPSVTPSLDQQLEHACDQAELALRVALARRSRPPRSEWTAIEALCEHVLEQQRAQWLSDSRPGGLEDSLAHWRAARGA